MFFGLDSRDCTREAFGYQEFYLMLYILAGAEPHHSRYSIIAIATRHKNYDRRTPTRN
jgi:hypothetical protein